MEQQNTHEEDEDQNNAESNFDQDTQETSVETIARLEQENANKDRKIQEEVNRRQTIEARLAHPSVNSVPLEDSKTSGLELMKRAAANLIDDPEKGASEFNEFIQNAIEKSRNETTASITVGNEISNLEKESPHLTPFMPMIKNKAHQLMNSGLTLNEALRSAKEEYQAVFKTMTGKSKTDSEKDLNNKHRTIMKGDMNNKSVRTTSDPLKTQSVSDEYLSRNSDLRSKFSLGK